MTDMIAQIRSLGDQLRWSADLEAPDPGAHAEILYAGMGGSGIAGDYAAAMTGPTSARIAVHKGYGPLPGWVERIRPLVVAASYSGNTEETLEVVTAAWEAGLPVATITTYTEPSHALGLANATRFGLGGSVWTEDAATGEAIARGLQCGCAFVNEMVRSDPRLPFGGVKDSGFGRELGVFGIREFVNIKTLWIA